MHEQALPLTRLDLRTRGDTTLAEAIVVDRAIPAADATRQAIARELDRPSRRYLMPIVRLVSLVAVALIVTAKRILPFQFSSHALIDRLGVWCLRHLVSPEGVYLLLRHFIVESQLINFVVRNAGDDSIAGTELLPTSLDELYDNAVMEHDRNIYRLVVQLGRSKTVSFAPKAVDFSDLDVPTIDTEAGRQRLLNLDLETSLYLMNIFFCLFTTEDEYEQAVNSFAFDHSLLSYIADITGDDSFRRYTPMKFRMWVSIRRDVAREVYWHAIVNEYAHTRLCQLRDGGDSQRCCTARR